MMLISDYDVEATLQFAIRYTASRLGATETEWKTVHELREEIGQLDPEIGRLLSEYIDAYLNWYRWHKEIDRTGKQGALTADEQRELVDLTAARDRTRSVIANRIRELP